MDLGRGFSGKKAIHHSCAGSKLQEALSAAQSVAAASLIECWNKQEIKLITSTNEAINQLGTVHGWLYGWFWGCSV